MGETCFEKNSSIILVNNPLLQILLKHDHSIDFKTVFGAVFLLVKIFRMNKEQNGHGSFCIHHKKKVDQHNCHLQMYKFLTCCYSNVCAQKQKGTVQMTEPCNSVIISTPNYS